MLIKLVVSTGRLLLQSRRSRTVLRIGWHQIDAPMVPLASVDRFEAGQVCSFVTKVIIIDLFLIITITTVC